MSNDSNVWCWNCGWTTMGDSKHHASGYCVVLCQTCGGVVATELHPPRTSLSHEFPELIPLIRSFVAGQRERLQSEDSDRGNRQTEAKALLSALDLLETTRRAIEEHLRTED